MNNNEPISEGSPLIYTERKEGVLPGYDVRTDRFEVAVDAMDKVHADKIAKREARMKVVRDEDKPDTGKNGTGGTDGGAEPVQGTDGK